MFPIEVFRGTVLKLVEILQELSVPYQLVGGVTSIAWGEPRMTQDVDLVVAPERMRAELEGFLRALQDSDFLYTAEEVRQATCDGGMFQLMDQQESLKLDVYPSQLIPGELDRSQMGEVFRGLSLPIASREDTIVAKLVWINKGSHKSRRDVRVLYRNTDDRQKAFVAEHAARLELTDLLAEVLAEPDEIR